MGRGGIPCDAIEAQPHCVVALLPGPTADTLSILAMGGDVSASTGELLLTTVSVQSTLGFRDWLRGNFDDRIAHLDRDLFYPPGVSEASVREDNVLSMEQSQLAAILAAFLHLGFSDVFAGAEIVEIAEFSNAVDGTLQVGDVIVEAAGTAVAVRADLTSALARFGVGDDVALVIERGARRSTVTISLVAAPDGDRAVLGISVEDHYEFPVEVSIDAGPIGGPSAGLMFALAIVDARTPADLTGGRIIAGTGEIEPDGLVKPIGGIHQKILGATTRFDEDFEPLPPATVFLVPLENMAEARTTPVRNGIMLVPVHTLSEAVAALEAISSGERPAGAEDLRP